MGTVGENLLGKLSFENAQPGGEPILRLVAVEIEAREDQRLRVGEQMIAEEVPFDLAAERSRLDREALRSSHRSAGCRRGSI